MMLPVDLATLVRVVGYGGVFAIVFAESGLLIGFFLPGDSLLFTAGFLASQGALGIRLLVPLCFIAAVAGDAGGYAFGYRVGRRLFQREDSLLFHRKHLLRAEAFFARHGGKAVVLARFLPVVRTFTPIVAGIATMRYPRFAAFNVLGALLWAAGVTIAGNTLGSTVPGADRYLLPMTLAIIVISSAPSVLHLLGEHRAEIRARLRAGSRIGAALGLGAALLLGLAALGLAVRGDYLAIDEPLAAGIQARAAGLLGVLFGLLNRLGNLPVWGAVVGLTASALLLPSWWELWKWVRRSGG